MNKETPEITAAKDFKRIMDKAGKHWDEFLKLINTNDFTKVFWLAGMSNTVREASNMLDGKDLRMLGKMCKFVEDKEKFGGNLIAYLDYYEQVHEEIHGSTK